MERIPSADPDSRERRLLQRYCEEAEPLIRAAESRDRALALRDEICTRFAHECQSSLVFTATREYLTSIIDSHWNNRHAEHHPNNQH
jgi:hypothetical protein